MVERKGISLPAVSKVNSEDKEVADVVVAITVVEVSRGKTDCVVNFGGADVTAMLETAAVLPEEAPNEDPMKLMISNKNDQHILQLKI